MGVWWENRNQLTQNHKISEAADSKQLPLFLPMMESKKSYAKNLKVLKE